MTISYWMEDQHARTSPDIPYSFFCETIETLQDVISRRTVLILHLPVQLIRGFDAHHRSIHLSYRIYIVSSLMQIKPQNI